ncbi:ScbR family autoregulator-binding transcription factor [Streptomyces sp. NPDC041068]|uniref:ScbR family autoregulator-binding transcription factor n=1 Tax=Streptomyces sp. NPDC041068 TaxID=3155130 RepID=UPI0033D919A8
MARQERAVRTRKAVLEAAAEVFAQRGYEGTTISEVLSLSGVTKGALYFHFPSKEALAKGVLQYAVTETFDRSVKLQALVDMGLVLAYRLPREALLRGAARLAADQSAGPFFGGPWGQWQEIFTDLITEAQQRGEVFAHIAPAETARVLVGAFTGLQLSSLTTTDPDDLVGLVARWTSMFMPALATPGVLGVIDISPGRARQVYEELGHPREETND